MFEIYFSKEEIEEILSLLKEKKVKGAFYAPKKVIFHGKAALFASFFSLTVADDREKALERIKREVLPVEDGDKGKIYPLVVSLPLGFLEEDFEIAKEGAEKLFKKISQLAKEKGFNLDDLAMEEKFFVLCKLMEEGKLTYDEVFWYLFLLHALAGWETLKKWNEQTFRTNKRTEDGGSND